MYVPSRNSNSFSAHKRELDKRSKVLGFDKRNPMDWVAAGAGALGAYGAYRLYKSPFIREGVRKIIKNSSKDAATVVITAPRKTLNEVAKIAKEAEKAGAESAAKAGGTIVQKVYKYGGDETIKFFHRALRRKIAKISGSAVDLQQDVAEASMRKWINTTVGPEYRESALKLMQRKLEEAYAAKLRNPYAFEMMTERSKVGGARISRRVEEASRRGKVEQYNAEAYADREALRNSSPSMRTNFTASRRLLMPHLTDPNKPISTERSIFRMLEQDLTYGPNFTYRDKNGVVIGTDRARDRYEKAKKALETFIRNKGGDPKMLDWLKVATKNDGSVYPNLSAALDEIKTPGAFTKGRRSPVSSSVRPYKERSASPRRESLAEKLGRMRADREDLSKKSATTKFVYREPPAIPDTGPSYKPKTQLEVDARRRALFLDSLPRYTPPKKTWEWGKRLPKRQEPRG